MNRSVSQVCPQISFGYFIFIRKLSILLSQDFLVHWGKIREHLQLTMFFKSFDRSLITSLFPHQKLNGDEALHWWISFDNINLCFFFFFQWYDQISPVQLFLL